ncbi:hypothetical protein E3N88_36511 [Mikania micrantha]|uniref:Uncharacterized protein n=1 Tax=Mikania micrantha TaxID=192012 RepID=A0A5N6M4G7_9ASTR|nr:hypothetical protein E3N88_36511 [Mikania micrantha]
MDSVISLMNEVEHKEKLAEEAVENVGESSLDILAKVEELKRRRIIANERNQTLAKKVGSKGVALSAAMDALQIRVANLLSIGDSYVSDLDEIRRALEIRLISALTKKEKAKKDALKIEASAREALVFEEREIDQGMINQKEGLDEVVYQINVVEDIAVNAREEAYLARVWSMLAVMMMVVMIDKAFEVALVNFEDDSMLNDMTTSLGQICGTELLETSIEDARNKKNSIISKIDSVTSLMREVEFQEKAAEQTKLEAAQTHSDIMLKVYELMDMQQHVKKKNIMLAGEAYVQKKLLSAKVGMLKLHVASLLDKGDRSIELLDEMSRSLETRLTSAMMNKKAAIKKKKETEAFARAALAYEEIQMKKVEEESKRLKQEAVEIFQLQEFLIDRDHLVTVLHGEISKRYQDVRLLEGELDQVVGFCETDIKNSYGVADITKSVKKVKIKGKSRGYRSRMCAKSIKKLKIESQMHATSVKNSKLNGIRHGSQMCAKTIRNLKIKCKLRKSQMFDKSIKKIKIKSKLHGNHPIPKSKKKTKIKVKQQGGQMGAKNTKKVKINGLLVVKKEGRCRFPGDHDK